MLLFFRFSCFPWQSWRSNVGFRAKISNITDIQINWLFSIPKRFNTAKKQNIFIATGENWRRPSILCLCVYICIFIYLFCAYSCKSKTCNGILDLLIFCEKRKCAWVKNLYWIKNQNWYQPPTSALTSLLQASQFTHPSSLSIHLSLSNWPPCPPSVLIIGLWSSVPGA